MMSVITKDFDSEEEETNEILTKFQNIERDK